MNTVSTVPAAWHGPCSSHITCSWSYRRGEMPIFHAFGGWFDFTKKACLISQEPWVLPKLIKDGGLVLFHRFQVALHTETAENS